MKRNLFLSIVALFVALCLSAQTTITNPGFEQWDSGTPNDWTTSISGNINYSLYGVNVPIPVALNFGTQTSDAHSGNYALKINASSLALAELAGVNITVPGFAQLGTAGEFSIDYETIAALIDTSSTEEPDWTQFLSLLNCFSHGVPFTQVPSRMNAWIKYQHDGTDTLQVIVLAYKSGEFMSGLFGDSISGGLGVLSYTTTATSTDWTQITVDIEGFSENTQCDSLAVIFISTSLENPKTESTLYVDDITFEFGGSSVGSAEKIEFSVYPNPTTDYLNIIPANQSETYDLQVVDQTGKVVKTMSSLSGNTQVDVNELSAGYYFVKIMQGGQQSVRNFVVK